jgi:Sel1 repeat
VPLSSNGLLGTGGNRLTSFQAQSIAKPYRVSRCRERWLTFYGPPPLAIGSVGESNGKDSCRECMGERTSCDDRHGHTQGTTNLKIAIQVAVTWLIAVTLLLQTLVSGNTSDLFEGLIRYATRDFGRAIEELRPLADRGDAVAQEILGKIHLTGDLATRNDITAFNWFLLSAERGRAESQFELGRMYRDGVGVSADSHMAMHWFELAAKRGMPDAYNAAGELWLGRSHFSKDAAAARRFFVNGAHLGSAAAMYNLGLIYLVGDRVDQDEIEAYKWFELSAQASVGQEHDNALRALVTLRERLTPMQVGVALVAARSWAAPGSNDRIAMPAGTGE